MNDRPQPGSRNPDYARAGRDERRAYEVAPKPAPRRALRFLPVALGILAGVVLVIVGATLLSHGSATAQPPSFTPTARQVCDDLTAQRYDALYGLLSQSQQQIGPRDQFVAVQRQLDAELGATHTCVYSAVQQDANHVTLTLTLTRGSTPAAKAQAQLTYEQQGWRISDYDTSLVAAPIPQSVN
jgi:hypothetical protein